MIWNYKPWWCQPWSIILTGLIIIGGSWWLFHNIFISIFLSILIITWWIYFLILYPRLMEKIIAEESPTNQQKL